MLLLLSSSIPRLREEAKKLPPVAVGFFERSIEHLIIACTSISATKFVSAAGDGAPTLREINQTLAPSPALFPSRAGAEPQLPRRPAALGRLRREDLAGRIDQGAKSLDSAQDRSVVPAIGVSSASSDRARSRCIEPGGKVGQGDQMARRLQAPPLTMARAVS